MADQNYAHAWADYKRRRLVGWLVPAVLLLGSWAIKTYSSQAPLALFVAAVVAWLGLQNWYERFPCPRCGKRFTEPGKVSEACSNCGLGKATMEIR
jgi:ribosomal protein L37E